MPTPNRTTPDKEQIKPITARQEQFCREYLLDMNATQAAIRAGYAAKGAHVVASRLLTQPEITVRITALRDERNARLNIKADDIVKRLVAIAAADPRNLVAYHVGPCRYCWGVNHAYQWRTQRELDEAREKATEAGKKLPTEAGGFGFKSSLAPNADCPECAGYGKGFTVIRDTRTLDPRDALLFQGVKQTREGVTVSILDQSAAVNRLAGYFGITSKQGESTTTPFADMLSQLLRAGGPHTRAPIRKDPPPSEGK